MSASSHVRQSESVVTLAFEVPDATIPAVSTAEAGGCRFVLEEIVPGAGADNTVYYRIEGCDPAVVSRGTPDEGAGTVYTADRDGSGHVLKVNETSEGPLFALTAEGALPRKQVVADGTGRLSVEVPPELDVNGIVSRFEAVYPAAELVVRRPEPYETPVFSDRGLAEVATATLTDRQFEVLLAAYREGFFEWPREKTGEDLSEDLGISPPTFHQHLRAAQQGLANRLFTDAERSQTALVDERP